MAKPVIEKFHEKKTLAKMLHNAKEWNVDIQCEVLSDDYERFNQEVDELVVLEKIQASSTSFLLPKAGFDLYKDIGFLLDSDQTVIRGIYTTDVASDRVDDDGNSIKWSMVQKCHCNIYDNEPRNFYGKIKLKSRRVKGVSSFKDLEQHMRDSCSEVEMERNEVIVDYTKSSIIGILATSNRLFRHFNSSENDIIKEVAIKVKVLITEKLGLDLPILIYDCCTGVMAEYNP